MAPTVLELVEALLVGFLGFGGGRGVGEYGGVRIGPCRCLGRTT